MAMVVICAAFLRRVIHGGLPYCIDCLQLIDVSLLPLGGTSNQPCWLAEACQLPLLLLTAVHCIIGHVVS